MIITTLITALIYMVYQIFRVSALNQILELWIVNHDERINKGYFNKYTLINKRNWYGLKYPNDKDFK